MATTWYEEPPVGGRLRFRISVTAAMMDLLTICRDYGVLVDREMIKYIRSTIMVDGLVTRLSPGFDIAGVLRTVIEEYLVEEASRKILSRAGSLSMLTDAAIWMKSGPASLLRALDLLEQRKVRVRTSFSSDSPRESGPLRKAFAAGAVWAFSIAFLALSGGLPSWNVAPLFAAITIAFVASWTLWTLLLLRRLATS
jgi:predicted unusual protein kinase regulating ubiquinone biosynthesis (AarF/ABC1/UbiB family)